MNSLSRAVESDNTFLGTFLLQQHYIEKKRTSNPHLSIPRNSYVTCKQRHNETVHLTSPQPILPPHTITTQPHHHQLNADAPKLPRPHFRLKNAHSDTDKKENHHDQTMVCKLQFACPSVILAIGQSKNYNFFQPYIRLPLIDFTCTNNSWIHFTRIENNFEIHHYGSSHL